MSLSLEKVKKISPKVLLKIIERSKKLLKQNQVVKDLCKDYDVSVDVLDDIPVKFGDIDVSARTDRGVITLNYRLLSDGDFIKDLSYLTHEITHYVQQCFGGEATQGANDGDYLKNPSEQEGFQNQVKYIAEEDGKEKAEEYVDQVLDYHDETGKERKEKEKALLKKVESFVSSFKICYEQKVK